MKPTRSERIRFGKHARWCEHALELAAENPTLASPLYLPRAQYHAAQAFKIAQRYASKTAA